MNWCVKMVTKKERDFVPLIFSVVITLIVLFSLFFDVNLSFKRECVWSDELKYICKSDEYLIVPLNSTCKDDYGFFVGKGWVDCDFSSLDDYSFLSQILRYEKNAGFTPNFVDRILTYRTDKGFLIVSYPENSEIDIHFKNMMESRKKTPPPLHD